MPTVTFLPQNVTFEARPGETVLQVAEDHDVPLEHSCGGFAACSTCHVIVEKGIESLPDPSEDEEDMLDRVPGGPTLKSRLGCQCPVTVDLVVRIPDSSRRIQGPPSSH